MTDRIAAGLAEQNDLAKPASGEQPYARHTASHGGDQTYFGRMPEPRKRRPFGDDLLVNLSVWEDVDSLKQFVFDTAHAAIMKRRQEWFERMGQSYLVLWWVPAGDRPTLDDAKDRLARLRDEGPSPDAFTFRDRFPPPDDATGS